MIKPVFFAPLLAALLGVAAGASAQHKTTTRASASKATKSTKVVKKKRTPRSPAVDPTEGDDPDGDDLTIRRAAVDALGNQAGTIVAVDPTDGRILTMVNQKLALRS